MGQVPQEFSRPIACAERLAAHGADVAGFLDKRVLLTGELAVLQTANGRLIALDTLRLLIRICPHVDVLLPGDAEALRAELAGLSAEIQFAAEVQFLDTVDLGRYNAIISVGAQARLDLPWTVVNSNGWLARVSSTASSLQSECRQTNAIGALATASLGVSEVFKRLLPLEPSRGAFFDALTFSCYDFTTGTENPGPRLPSRIALPVTLVCGQGAIGNGLSLLFSQMPFEGQLYLLDCQTYGPENLGTCVLLGPQGVGISKPLWNLRAFNAATVTAREIVGEIEKLEAEFGNRYPYPSVVVNGLDNIPARHAIQGLWPDILFDGAVGDFTCQIVSFAWGSEYGCLKCLFTEPSAPDPHVSASTETGLSLNRVRDGESPVTMTDVEAAPPEKQAALQASIGKKVCSVISEAMVARIAKAGSSSTFAPSVPFVATMSAAMVVGALTRRILEPDSLTPRFVFDVLQGPQYGELISERARPSCVCRVRKDAINRIRATRVSSAA